METRALPPAALLPLDPITEQKLDLFDRIEHSNRLAVSMPQLVSRRYYRFWEAPFHMYNSNPASFAFHDLVKNHGGAMERRYFVNTLIQFNPKYFPGSKVNKNEPFLEYPEDASVNKERVASLYRNKLARDLTEKFGEMPETKERAKLWADVMKKGIHSVV